MAIKAEEISSILKEKIEPLMVYPLSCSGDFNSLQNGREYNEVVKFLRDSKFAAPDTMDYLTYHDDCPEKHEGHIIDFIFINDKVKAYKYYIRFAGVCQVFFQKRSDIFQSFFSFFVVPRIGKKFPSIKISVCYFYTNNIIIFFYFYRFCYST